MQYAIATVNLLNKIMILVLFSCVFLYAQESNAEIIAENLGSIGDLMIADNRIYFFEVDDTVQEPTWLYDTRIAYIENGEKHMLSTEKFIYPTQLNQMEDYLFFAVLSDSCIGQMICNYQNIIRMSKQDGSFDILDSDLKSAVHISVDKNNLYISESNGNIWKINFDESNKESVYVGENIIMDMFAEGGSIYWIEEVEDQKNKIMRIKQDQNIEVIEDNLQIPYNLKITFDQPSWMDVQVKPSLGSINDFTIVKVLDEDKIKTVAEFKNTSPVALAQKQPHYKPYFVYGDYIIVSNNTASSPVIQLINHKDENVIDLAIIQDYEVKYFRTDHQNLYIVGSNEDGFLIEKIAYPIVVPEFGPITLMILASMFVSIMIMVRVLPRRMIPI